MKADWTPAGGSLAHLGDDSAKWGIIVEQLGLAMLAQSEALYGSTTQFLAARGNAIGECVFTAQKSHADMDTMANFLATEVARLGQTGKLEITAGTHKWTMDNAVMKGVARVETDEARGVALRIRYSVAIVTLTYV